VMGALCGIIGSIQAMEAIKFVTGIGETLAGRLLVIDAATMGVRTLRIKRDAHCPACSARATIRSIDAARYQWNCALPPGDEIAPEVLKILLDGKAAPLLLDVREPDECAVATLPDAVCIPLGDLGTRIGELPKDSPIVVYCYGGMRSMNALKLLRGKGFSKTISLKGGVKAWSRQVDPSFPV